MKIYIGDKHDLIIKKLLNKMTKEKIPNSVRNSVWGIFFHDTLNGICVCCNRENISLGTFHCGHIISEHHGGLVNVFNLVPICQNCNHGTQNLIEMMRQYGFNKLNPDGYNKILNHHKKYKQEFIKQKDHDSKMMTSS